MLLPSNIYAFVTYCHSMCYNGVFLLFAENGKMGQFRCASRVGMAGLLSNDTQQA